MGIKEENESIVIDYLCKYNSMKMRIALIDKEIAEEETKIKTITGAPIAKYGNDVGGGHSELIGLEGKSEALMQCEINISRLVGEKRRISNLLSGIDIVIGYLPDEQKAVLHHKYIQRKTWRMVAGELGTYTNYCRRIADKAISTMSAALSKDNTVPLERLRRTEE